MMKYFLLNITVLHELVKDRAIKLSQTFFLYNAFRNKLRF